MYHDSTPMSIFPERRRGERWATQQSVKLYDSRTGRYIAGVMRNASASGALLELHGSLGADLGDRVRLAIADRWSDLVAHDEMTPAVVRRFAGGTHATRWVAIEFATTPAVSLAA